METREEVHCVAWSCVDAADSTAQNTAARQSCALAVCACAQCNCVCECVLCMEQGGASKLRASLALPEGMEVRRQRQGWQRARCLKRERRRESMKSLLEAALAILGYSRLAHSHWLLWAGAGPVLRSHCRAHNITPFFLFSCLAEPLQSSAVSASRSCRDCSSARKHETAPQSLIHSPRDNNSLQLFFAHRSCTVLRRSSRAALAAHLAESGGLSRRAPAYRLRHHTQ